MLTYYGGTAGTLKYINMLEDSQKNTQRVQLPIPNVTIVAVATKSILRA